MAANLIRSPWRQKLGELVGGARRSLLIAAPFIRLTEARWLRASGYVSNLGNIELTVLTELRADSVLNKSLDIEALRYFADSFERHEIVNVPRLHAKVYVADAVKAIVTSANLTTAGLDQNAEYGIEIENPSLVKQIVQDMREYASLGSPVPYEVLSHLADVGADLVYEYERMERSAGAEFRRQFNAKLRSASVEFIATQVGHRSAHAVFCAAILYALRNGPMTTRHLNSEIQTLLPDLCDDSVELVINGQRFGKRWKHQVRNSQLGLKRQGQAIFDGMVWKLPD